MLMEENKEINEQEDFRDRYLRAIADYQNLKNRITKDRLTLVYEVRNEFIKKLIPLYDDIFNSTAYDNDGSKNLILKKFQDVLSEFKVEVLKDLQGEKFDSNIAEAVAVTFTNNSRLDNIVYKTTKHGFKDAETGKIIDYAKVIVFKYGEK